MENLLPVLSLAIAALAVFVGPAISWGVAKRQIASAVLVARESLVAPMHHTWVIGLRDLLAELISRATHYWAAGFEDRDDEEYYRLTLLEHQIQLMLDPELDEHAKLEGAIRKMLGSLNAGKAGDEEFHTARAMAIEMSRRILRERWKLSQ